MPQVRVLSPRPIILIIRLSSGFLKIGLELTDKLKMVKFKKSVDKRLKMWYNVIRRVSYYIVPN